MRHRSHEQRRLGSKTKDFRGSRPQNSKVHVFTFKLVQATLSLLKPATCQKRWVKGCLGPWRPTTDQQLILQNKPTWNLGELIRSNAVI